MWRRSTWLLWISERMCFVYLVALLLFCCYFFFRWAEALSILTLNGTQSKCVFTIELRSMLNAQPPLVLYLTQTEHKLKRFLFLLVAFHANIRTHTHKQTNEKKKFLKCINTSIKLLQFFGLGTREEWEFLFFGNEKKRYTNEKTFTVWVSFFF